MTKDEVKAIVIETLDEKAKEVTSKEQTDLAAKDEKEKATKADTAMVALNVTIKDIVDKVDGIVKKQEELGNQIVSAPAGNIPASTVAPTIQDKPRSVFSGLITGRKS